MHQEHNGNRPKPSSDGVPRLLTSEYCGFATREELDWWFRSHKRTLYQEGFNIAVYLVPPELIRYGHRQLVFERGNLLPDYRLPIVRGMSLRK